MLESLGHYNQAQTFILEIKNYLNWKVGILLLHQLFRFPRNFFLAMIMLNNYDNQNGLTCYTCSFSSTILTGCSSYDKFFIAQQRLALTHVKVLTIIYETWKHYGPSKLPPKIKLHATGPILSSILYNSIYLKVNFLHLLKQIMPLHGDSFTKTYSTTSKSRSSLLLSV